jgi:ATP-binding cassette subfamily B protein
MRRKNNGQKVYKMGKIKYFRQNTIYSCGPACLRMMLPAFDLEATEIRLIDFCGTTSLGTTCEQILEAAQLFGLEGEVFKGVSHSEFDELLRTRLPFIALIDAAVLYGGNLMSGHFVVVLNIKDGQIIYHDPAKGPSCSVSKELFLSAWKVFNFRGVRLWKPRKSTKK